MQFLNKDALVLNIVTLMKNKGITQEKLAEALGMSQPNVSRALNPLEKKCFTLDQIVGISKLFNVPIDKLVNSSNETYIEKLSVRDIGKFVVSVLEKDKAKLHKITVNEDAYVYSPELEWEENSNPVEYEPNKSSSYFAVYFPNYWEVPPYDPYDEETRMLIAEAEQIGNESGMAAINDFLCKYMDIFKVYRQKGIDEDAYHMVVNSYLKRLRDE